ncbi:cytochrome c-type biogenesis protein [Nitrincola alkalilacustris]|uniref:cytochrome c-type biogenesis protein n=1 Tax=Nitrincola alkalilacustris TaxID=1571224 RepID=UPI00124E5D5E|nr:cytochrome c-type biogenesis protein [Nitrincola alkalilacustris]
MRYLLLFLLLMPGFAVAAIEGYEFSSSDNERRFHSMTQELRCPTCQNQNISDSDAPLAADLRREVHRMIEAGESDQAIIDFMVLRFGDFVHYRPRLTSTTWFLWYGPYVLLALGFLAVILVSHNRRRKRRTLSPDDADAVSSADVVPDSENETGLEAHRLTPQEQQQLQKLLQQEQDK